MRWRRRRLRKQRHSRPRALRLRWLAMTPTTQARALIDVLREFFTMHKKVFDEAFKPPPKLDWKVKS